MISFRAPRERKAMYEAAAERNEKFTSDFYRKAVDFALQIDTAAQEHRCSHSELCQRLLGLLQSCSKAAHHEKTPLIDYLHDIAERIAAGNVECRNCCD